MSRRPDAFELLREANPMSAPVEPDWAQVKGYAAKALDPATGSPPAPSHREPEADGRRSGRLGRSLGVLAVLAGAVTAVVLAFAPSGGSSDFLARAAAALTPTSGTVLYERWEATFGPEAGNRYRAQPITFGPEQLWIQSDHPRHYRTILLSRPGPLERPGGEGIGGADLAYRYGVNLGFAGFTTNPLARLQRSIEGQPLELGGATEAAHAKGHPGEVLPTLAWMPPGRLLRTRLVVTLGPSLPGPHDQAIEDGADPVQVLRAAIAEGRARVTGTTKLDGRTVEKISIHLPSGLPRDAPPLTPGHPPVNLHPEAQAYVEAGNFHPVEIVFGGETYRFQVYEYLPATPANLALTDIRRQHPHARVLDTVGLKQGKHAGSVRRAIQPHTRRPRRP